MKKLGKWILMSETEFFTDLRRTSDADNDTYTAGFNAGKWHSAGGYSHTLPKLKEELRQAQERVARYKPIGEIFEKATA